MDCKTEQVSRMILDYLRRNPDAGDTLEGITEWWMNVQKIEYSTKEVAETLVNLIRKGVIHAHHGKGSKTFYTLRKNS